jgi:hypothetical protein
MVCVCARVCACVRIGVYLFVTMPTLSHNAKCLTNVHLDSLTDLKTPNSNFYCRQHPFSMEQTLLRSHDSVNILVSTITAHHNKMLLYSQT